MKKANILLIDNAHSCACNNCFLPGLKKEGYRINAHYYEKLGLEDFKSQQKRYDAVLINIMNLTKAIGLVRKIREIDNRVVIIVITYINGGPTEVNSIFKAGANSFVPKPIAGPDFLIEMMERCLKANLNE